MKTAISLSTALLLALSLTACGNNDDNADGQDQSSGNSGMSSEQSGGDSMSDSQSGGDQSMNEGDGMQEGSGDKQMESGGDSMSGSQSGGDQSKNEDDSMQGSGQMSDDSKPKAAMAQLKGTKGNEGVTAVIKFTAKDGGVAYTSQAKGLAPGKHGYHIHVKPDCSSPDGKSAGTHFNLQGSSENPPKDIKRITGNLGDLEAGDNGSAKGDGMLAKASLTGDKGLIGHSVIIHAQPNDPSQPPMGATGARIACGVIQASQPAS